VQRSVQRRGAYGRERGVRLTDQLPDETLKPTAASLPRGVDMRPLAPTVSVGGAWERLLERFHCLLRGWASAPEDRWFDLLLSRHGEPLTDGPATAG
jgi:hypothetical protein